MRLACGGEKTFIYFSFYAALLARIWTFFVIYEKKNFFEGLFFSAYIYIYIYIYISVCVFVSVRVWKQGTQSVRLRFLNGRLYIMRQNRRLHYGTT